MTPNFHPYMPFCSSKIAMMIKVSRELYTWLSRHGLGGYLRVLNVAPHPGAQAGAKLVHPDTITNNQIRSALSLQLGGEHDVGAPPQHILEKYFKEYSASAKAHCTHGGSNEFFGNLAHFLLEFGCIIANAYNITKKRVGLIITAYRGGAVDWGILTGEEILHNLYHVPMTRGHSTPE